MKKQITLIALASTLALSGCARLVSKTYDPKTGAVTSVARCTTFFDSQSGLTKFNNRVYTVQSNEWSAGTYIGGLNQSSTSTNLNDLIGTVVGAAVTAAAKSAKP